MTVRRLDSETGDIITSGVQFIGDKEEVAQTINTRLRLFLGEYFRDIKDGTAYWEIIFNKNAPPQLRDSEIKRRIAETEGVTQVLTFESNYDINSRNYTVKAEVLSVYGLIQLNIEEGL